nr:glycosyltransferase [Roseibium sp. CAU 1639]
MSADYPNPHRDRSTTAVERLVKKAPDSDHIVISLSRSGNPVKTHFIDCGATDNVRVIAYRYFAPPMGLFLASCMRVVARRVAAFLEQEQLLPDIIHAHKFAFEGISALWLCDRLGQDVKLMVSVRGEADRKILLFKPTYRRLMRRIAARSDRIYHVSAWFRETFHTYLPEQPDKERLLPNIVANTTTEVRTRPAGNRFTSVFNLDIRRRKGASALLKGFAQFRHSHPDIGLDLIGPGSPDSVEAIDQEITRLGLQDSVRLLGPMDSDALFAALPGYLGMALLSHNETFGMVYLEALFAGIPIAYGKDTGIDGYLDDVQAGVSVRPGDIRGIAEAFEKLLEKNAYFRKEIASSSRLLHDRFNPEMIGAVYRQDIEDLLAIPQQRSHAT